MRNRFEQKHQKKKKQEQEK